MAAHFTETWESPKPNETPYCAENGRRLIFAEEFIIIYSNKVDAPSVVMSGYPEWVAGIKDMGARNARASRNNRSIKVINNM